MQQQELCTYSSHYNWQCVDFRNSLQMKTLVLINIHMTFVWPQVIFIPEFLYHYAECSLLLDYKYVHTISSKWNWPKNTHIKSSLQKSMRSYVIDISQCWIYTYWYCIAKIFIAVSTSIPPLDLSPYIFWWLQSYSLASTVLWTLNQMHLSPLLQRIPHHSKESQMSSRLQWETKYLMASVSSYWTIVWTWSGEMLEYTTTNGG